MRVVVIVVALLLVAFAGWLLATPDPDGGRRPVGIVILVVTIPVLGVAVWRKR